MESYCFTTWNGDHLWSLTRDDKHPLKPHNHKIKWQQQALQEYKIKNYEIQLDNKWLRKRLWLNYYKLIKKRQRNTDVWSLSEPHTHVAFENA